MRYHTGVFSLGLLLALSACGGDVNTAAAPASAPIPALSQVSAADWERLAQRRIFFGHQSVGQNLLDGLADVLAAHPAVKLRVVAATAVDSVAGPALIHAKIGRNGEPTTKNAAFGEMVSAAHDPSLVALYKYCYLDTDFSTDPAQLFADYRSQVDSLRRTGLTIVHVTMPLTTSEDGARAFVKRLLRRPMGRDLNARRARYNRLLREAYAGHEPVFDLAQLESTRPDGSRAFFGSADGAVEVLAAENTDDGGHLNAAARRRVAEAFLAFLAKLP